MLCHNLCRDHAWDEEIQSVEGNQTIGGDFAELLAEAEHLYGQASYRNLAIRKQDEDDAVPSALSGASVAKAEQVLQGGRSACLTLVHS